MKKGVIWYVLFLFLFPLAGRAQILFHDSFEYDYTGAGDLSAQTSNVWKPFESTTGADSKLIQGSLSYPGAPASEGNKILFDGAGKGYFRAFTGQVGSGTLYGSCIINVKTLPNSTVGDHFAFFGNNSATMSAVYIRKSETAGKFNVGLGKRKDSPVTWVDLDMDINVNHYIVFSYTAIPPNPGNNDVVQLWVNPQDFEDEPMPDVVISAGADVNLFQNLVRFGLNHSAANNNAGLTMEIDEVRVSTTWSGKPVQEPVAVPQGIYYVDADNGDNSNDGLSESTAWKTLSKVNHSIFQPGSKILFKSGGAWTGQLYPKGSGEDGAPIIIDKYGDGPKPFFNGNGMIANGVVKLFNQSFWEINNLEIVNDGISNAERRGVEINASNYGLIQHIHLKNLEVHHIRGTIGGTLPDKRSAGIYFTVSNDDAVATRYDNILVEGCLIYNCQNQGIVTNNEVTASNYPGTAAWERRKITNLVVRNNIIHHISKNAMIIRLDDGGLVERNLCYETATGTTGNTIFSRSSRNTVFQYNEGYLNRALENGDYDGSLYDPDLNSPGTIWQYSYSHDNSDGLIVFCTDYRDDGVIVRYNISQNDKGDLVKINFPFAGAEIYNNTFYIGVGLRPVVIKEIEEDHTYTFQNNIIYNAEGNLATNPRFVTVNSKQNRTITNNVFYRVSNTPAHISFTQNYNFDPLFVNPGNGQVGLLTVGGYQLKPESPALGQGAIIPNNGGQDYFGNPVSADTPPNIGFYNGPGTNSDILPIEMLSATAQKSRDGDGINISWTTASEKDNAWFIIERSPDGIHFEQIAKIAASGNTTAPVQYSHKDKNPHNGANYYRIKQVDFNGNFSYAKQQLFVDFGDVHAAEIQVYPNPVKDKLFVNMKGYNGTGDVAVTLHNIQGEQLIAFKTSSDVPVIQVDLGSIKQGIYLLKLKEAETGKVLSVSKVLKTD